MAAPDSPCNFQAAIDGLYAEKPDHDFIVISHPIERALHQKLTRVLERHRQEGQARAKCTVFLTTYGGDAHAGFRVARCLRHHYKEGVRVVVPSYCKSAGTLVAIGANELAIGDLGELGPLDVQVSKPTEILERGSGLDYTQALLVALDHAQMAFSKSLLQMRGRLRLSTKMAGELATQLACGVVEPLYAQIDPNRIGEMQRAIQIAHEYGSRLDGHGSNLMDGALDTLVAGYPSHSFVIDRKEARRVFKSVQSLTPAEQQLCTTLWFLVGEQQEDDAFCDLLKPTIKTETQQEDNDAPKSNDGIEPNEH
ncbi:SDH family Clp fold serine proteinase [Piscinibacter sakaiensis]|uniref:SDH family Clp fold serine proteinase n=1 Tax=Piscinibacter sakaiensis TaxID=1547922 RepID=UPI003AAB6E65